MKITSYGVDGKTTYTRYSDEYLKYVHSFVIEKLKNIANKKSAKKYIKKDGIKIITNLCSNFDPNKTELSQIYMVNIKSSILKEFIHQDNIPVNNYGKIMIYINILHLIYTIYEHKILHKKGNGKIKETLLKIISNECTQIDQQLKELFLITKKSYTQFKQEYNNNCNIQPYDYETKW